MALANRKAVMTLYSDPRDLESHSVRLVLAEKNILNVDIISLNNFSQAPELAELNPYQKTLTLIDRDLILYDIQVIMEYLDERFPHPPLMPLDPVWRANNRMCRQRIGHELYTQITALESDKKKAANAARQCIGEALQTLAPLFAQKDFFMSDEMTLLDCYFAPLLWRLPLYHIDLATEAEAVNQYAQRLFARDAFQSSLSPVEREMRP